MNRTLPWIAALLLSILANGVMLGLVLHTTAEQPRFERHHPRGDGPPQRSGDGFNFRAFMNALPEAAREDARARLTNERDQLRALFRQTREAQITAQAAVGAEPYDAAAVQQAFDDLRAARMAMERAVETLILDVVAGLEAEDRVRAIEAGRAPPRHGPGRRNHRPPPPEQF